MTIRKQLMFAAVAGPSVLMLTLYGCTGGARAPLPVVQKQEQPAPRQEPVTLQPEPVAPKKEVVVSRPEPATLQPETALPAEKGKPVRAIQPRRPPSDAQTAPAAGTALPKPAKASCKVRNDAVAWRHVNGGCRNGYAQGSGRAVSVDGKRTYSGEFASGYFSGQGEYHWGDGTTYSGGFKKSKKHGRGILIYPDKSRYTGEFRDNLYEGEGAYVSAEGDTYTGSFAGGHYNGRGSFTWSNGNTYSGEFRDDRMAGAGTFTLKKGERFTGRFKDNEMDGQGTYTWPNGDRYAGEFRDDTMNGEGEYAYAGGLRYVGRFKDGRKDGEGTLFTPDGAVKQVWKNGEKTAELPAEK